ncbi:hypothetical protein [Clostridium formicaceticum]|uniref:Uncharacterized protein n=1 Tax=Clostridium formicaceticum TaxID=1497 RepID=A0AAC9WIA2_9CLOT|nr:hypothetical protein [Clostridium formicaceticum]AOY75125.1 hypothetical protein BJL90_03925 [Clostridium formicaceticum]ARE89549.1 hypothetical protein CLFO_40270 [Clostridium formicaceticum]
MNKRGQAMFMVTLFLLAILIAKSLWFDPVGVLEGDREKYQLFAFQVAPLQNTSLLERGGLLTYSVIYVLKESEEGNTKIMYKEDKAWLTEELKGQYRAKVRAYIFRVIPIKDIYVQGGLQE